MTALFPQAVVVRDARGPRVVARSPGFDFALEEAALKLAVAFGPRPPGVACPDAVFAAPLGPRHVAVARAADRGSDLGFHVLAVPLPLYRLLGDPFRLADLYLAEWPRGEPADVGAATFTPARRAVADVQAILKTGDGPLLLGTAQALLDGGRVAVPRDSPDPGFVRALWQLLPDRVRAELYPGTFAFAAEAGFHLVALPIVPRGYLGEEQARDYPEGRYELALQTAAEAGDQAELDRLFARKTSREVLRLAAGMVLFALAVAAIMKFL